MSNNSNKIFIGNLSSRITPKDLYRSFEEFGKIVRCDLKENFAFIEFESSGDCREAIRSMHRSDLQGKNIVVEMSHSRGPRTGDSFRSRGSFRDDYGGRRRDDYGGRRSDGDRDRYEGRRSDRDRDDSRRERGADHYRSHSRNYRLKVRNLSNRVSWQDLKDFAREKVGNSVVRTDVWVSRGENCGMVEFSDRGDYDYALRNLAGKRLEGRELETSEFTRDDGFEMAECKRQRWRKSPSPARRSRRDKVRSRSRSYSSRRSSRSFPKEAEKSSRESSARRSESKSRSHKSPSAESEKSNKDEKDPKEVKVTEEEAKTDEKKILTDGQDEQAVEADDNESKENTEGLNTEKRKASESEKSVPAEVDDSKKAKTDEKETGEVENDLKE